MPKNFSSVARQVIQYSRRMEFDGMLFLNVFKSFFVTIFMDQRKEFKKIGRRRMYQNERFIKNIINPVLRRMKE